MVQLVGHPRHLVGHFWSNLVGPFQTSGGPSQTSGGPFLEELTRWSNRWAVSGGPFGNQPCGPSHGGPFLVGDLVGHFGVTLVGQYLVGHLGTSLVGQALVGHLWALWWAKIWWAIWGPAWWTEIWWAIRWAIFGGPFGGPSVVGHLVGQSRDRTRAT